jgi:hypothetical protein
MLDSILLLLIIIFLYKRYLKVKPNQDLDIFKLWEQNKTIFPVIYEQFKIYYALPAMSTPSERLFSSAGYQVWDRGNKISPEKVNQVNFIVENEDL